MKHPFSITVILILLFVAAQLTGLYLVSKSITEVTIVEGNVTLAHSSTAIGERPQLHGYQSFLYLFIGVAIGTALLLLLVRFKQVRFWKLWFLIAVWLATTIALGVLLPQLVALALALLLALFKVFKPNPVVHNLTEILMYAGIAVLLVPIFDLFWIIMLLLLVSVYDFIAVWKTKHMVSMAKFQMESVFAGLALPKRQDSAETARAATKAALRTATKKTDAKTTAATAKSVKPTTATPPGRSFAILGGGDVAFPLLFAGVVLESLVAGGFPKGAAFLLTLAVPAFAAVALTLLLFLAKKDRFYPAMPFLTAGCLAGWAVTLLLV